MAICSGRNRQELAEAARQNGSELTLAQAALEAVAAEQGRRGRFRTRVEVAPDAAGEHDQLVYSLGRELVVNAAKHARANQVSLRVEVAGDDLVLEVEDDGCGMAASEREQALREGHIGLASGSERVEALGGELAIDSEPGIGTRVRVVLPLEGSPAGEAVASAAL